MTISTPGNGSQFQNANMLLLICDPVVELVFGHIVIARAACAGGRDLSASFLDFSRHLGRGFDTPRAFGSINGIQDAFREFFAIVSTENPITLFILRWSQMRLRSIDRNNWYVSNWSSHKNPNLFTKKRR